MLVKSSLGIYMIKNFQVFLNVQKEINLRVL